MAEIQHRRGDPDKPPPRDGLTRYYSEPQQGRGWNRRPQEIARDEMMRRWPMCGQGNHKTLCGECTKCGRSVEEIEAQILEEAE